MEPMSISEQDKDTTCRRAVKLAGLHHKKAIKSSSLRSKHKQSPKMIVNFLNHPLYQKWVDLGMIILPFYAQTWSDLSTTVKSHYDKRNRSLLASRMEPTVQMRRVKMRMEEQIWQYTKSMSQTCAPILQWNQVLPLESIRGMFYQELTNRSS